MSDLILQSLDITNFRSIRGHIHAPLDAQVILVHGENGAGKTSLLSALELALTGGVSSLLRADPNYERQLLHRAAHDGSVVAHAIRDSVPQAFKALLSEAGATSQSALDAPLARFFRQRAFLPQSLLGQLLQIYQEAGSDASSPLAEFVGKLLGLDQLDALEAGLKPLVDVRNVRKNVDGWLAAENEKMRLDRLRQDQDRNVASLNLTIRDAQGELAALCTQLELSVDVSERNLDAVVTALAASSDSASLARIADHQRRLASIRREIAGAQAEAGTVDTAIASDGESEKLALWEIEYGERARSLRARVQSLLSGVSLPSDELAFADEALARLRAERTQLDARVQQARRDIERHATAQDERDVAVQQRETIDEEVALFAGDAGSLGAALADLTSFIADDICPVCDRDFSEVSPVPLGDHVHTKVRTLTASAERLLTLGRTRGEVQVTIERLDREIVAIGARKLDEEALAAIDRRSAEASALILESESIDDAVREGARLRATEVAARRVVSEATSRHVALAAARDTLSAFARLIEAPDMAESETFDVAAARMAQFLASKTAHLEQRLSQRRQAADHIAAIRSSITKRDQAVRQGLADLAAWQRADDALERAQELRKQAILIRDAVDTVRSTIIRRAFNDRLNLLWRDLFVRLAPAEPFVPAFRIPEKSTQRLEPKLITEHRDGGEAGGTPGAMLSAGNLNTAALTLFVALHLSVPKELPWLILDDPVQSMDDVHIAHFAALLRTLSKEHGRQVMIAVHDRQLFEYLRLELSPAFAEDSLLTLELSRGARRDSVCVSKRYSFQTETALLAAA